MPEDLQVANRISSTPQRVKDPADNSCGLEVASQETRIFGKDVVGGSLPLRIVNENTPQEHAEGKTWGRFIRLQAVNQSGFFDIGIDSATRLFVNVPSSTKDQHVLVIDKDGFVYLQGLAKAPAGTVDLKVDPATGRLYRE